MANACDEFRLAGPRESSVIMDDLVQLLARKNPSGLQLRFGNLRFDDEVEPGVDFRRESRRDPGRGAVLQNDRRPL